MNRGFSLILLCCFIEGAAVIAVELLGAKIISPRFGDSLIVWSSVFAVSLSGLGLGYLIGGKLSSLYDGYRLLSVTFTLCAIIVFLMPHTGAAVMEATLPLDIRWGSLISSMLFLTPPLILLGMISPIAVSIGAPTSTTTGHAAGNVFAVSTVGGITGALVTGFYLIPFPGLTLSISLIAFLLLAASLMLFAIRR